MPISDRTAIEQQQILASAYAQWTIERGNIILRQCEAAGLDTETFEAAISRHLADTTRGRDGSPRGQWPPSAADILAHAEDIQREKHRAQVNARDRDSDYDQAKKRTVTVPSSLRAYIGKIHMELATSYCAHCADTGMARFYADPNDWRRVWLAPEALRVDDAIVRGLRVYTAVCDCRKGLERAEEYKDTIRAGHIATMARIRQLAKERPEYELEVAA